MRGGRIVIGRLLAPYVADRSEGSQLRKVRDRRLWITRHPPRLPACPYDGARTRTDAVREAVRGGGGHGGRDGGPGLSRAERSGEATTQGQHAAGPAWPVVRRPRRSAGRHAGRRGLPA